MRKGKRVLVVIPARGGSKGIPHKNITPVAGLPLIGYTIKLLEKLPWIDSSVVSTDDDAIAAEALRGGTADVVWRPESLSGDRVGDMPVLLHALSEEEAKSNEQYDIVLMLQPTSPLRTVYEVEECIDTLLDGHWDSVWTVSETDTSYHPYKQVKLSPGGQLDFYHDSGEKIVARQELEPAYYRNGVCYAFSARFVRSASSVFSPGRSTAVVLSRRHISIDTAADIALVEKELLERHNP